MRSKLFILSVGFAIGCGGGSDNPKLPDAKVFMDAAIDAAPVCSTRRVMPHSMASGVSGAVRSL